MSEMFDARIEFFKDLQCSEPLPRDNDGRWIISIPKIINVGEQESIDVYIQNNSYHEFEVQYLDMGDPDVKPKIDSAILQRDNPVKLTVTASPNAMRKDPIKAYLTIRGRFIVRG